MVTESHESVLDNEVDETTRRDVSMISFHKLAYQLHANTLVSAALKTRPHLLREALRGCDSVLDIGCGPDSLIKGCRNIIYSVGVEAFAPYLEQSRKAGIHSHYVHSDLRTVEFEPGSFDAVFLGEVIEHLPEDDARRLLARAEAWARHKVVLSTPNGFTRQPAVDGNPMQEHLSGWDTQTLEDMGYVVRGLWGWKALMKDYNDGNIFELVRFRPRYFWFGVMAITQLWTYYFPRSAFALFAVKKIRGTR